MAIIKRRPLTPAQRFLELSRNEVDNKRPERSLTESNHRAKGRNCYGRVTSRRRGGGHKRLYRIIDFKRDILDVPATVMAIEYDPYRTAYIALVQYENGPKRYIIAPDGLKKGDTILTTDKAPERISGRSLPAPQTHSSGDENTLRGNAARQGRADSPRRGRGRPARRS